MLLSSLVAIAALSALTKAKAQHGGLEGALQAANSSLLWGTYRPGLYFGLKPRMPSSLIHGLIWFGVHDFQSYEKLRHECSEGDDIVYTYTEHDGRSFAKQIIKDKLNNVELTTEFLKLPAEEGGGSWGVRISGKPLDEGMLSRISLINYFGNDNTLGHLKLEGEDDEGIAGDVKITGDVKGLGAFKVTLKNSDANDAVTAGPHAKDFGDKLEHTHFTGFWLQPGDVWAAKKSIQGMIGQNAQKIIRPYGNGNPPDPALLFQLPDKIERGSSVIAVQRAYEGTWSVDMFYDSESMPDHLDTTALTAGLSASSRAFHTRFQSTFPLNDEEFSPSHREFAEHVTSNLIGGIGYFYGSSIIDRHYKQDWDLDTEDGDQSKNVRQPEEMPPRQLLTATPSRSFFPRGFYWDEGFHLLPIGMWDNDLCLEIIKSWVDLIDEDGWIAREQILGEEARSRVPAEFQAQYPSNANPPTLVMAIQASINRAQKAAAVLSNMDVDFVEQSSSLETLHLQNSNLARSFLQEIYPKLKLHYEWFRSTQRGQIREYDREARSRTEAYRWRGRTKDHVLTSGLDDYPRARPPHLGELHLDLISWMAEFARTMKDLAQFLEEEDDVDDFDKHFRDIVDNIEDLHWSEEDQTFCDASVDENDESYFVCHKGYISLFPFLLSLIEPSSPKLGATLDLLRNPEHLWSNFGLRSLAKSDEFYGKGENYWRGPIWIQMNYMALSALHKTYAKRPGPYQVRAAEIYSELRKNVIDNIYQEYQRTGKVWEQYHPETGKGQRSNPFTGWTSLVVLIMAESY